VGYQGWLGSIVVSTNLMPWVVTVHMLLALVILAILVYTYEYARQVHQKPSVVMARLGVLKFLILLALVVSVGQIVLGTEVREAIDAVSKQLMYNARETWVAKTGNIFSYHRDAAVLVLIFNILIYKMVKDRFNGKATALMVANGVGIVLIIQIITGLLLSNFALPPYAQALHILFSTVLFTLQYYLYLLVYRTDTYQQEH